MANYIIRIKTRQGKRFTPVLITGESYRTTTKEDATSFSGCPIIMARWIRRFRDVVAVEIIDYKLFRHTRRYGKDKWTWTRHEK